jgi:hypothetical protein
MRRIHEAIGPQLRELERLGERIGREVESALEGLEAWEAVGEATLPPPALPSFDAVPDAVPAPPAVAPRALPVRPVRPAPPAPAPAPPPLEPPG